MELNDSISLDNALGLSATLSSNEANDILSMDDALNDNPPVFQNNIESSVSLDSIINAAPLDGPALLAQRKREMLNRYSSEFGRPQENINEPRTGSSGFFDALIPEGIFKNTKTDYRNITNTLDEFGNQELRKEPGLNDASLLLKEVYDLQKEFPDLMETEEGKALINDIEFRINTAKEQDEIGFMEMGNMLLDYAVADPAQFADLILDELVYNPVIPALAFAGYKGALGTIEAAGNATRVAKLVNTLRKGTPKQKAAAFAITNLLNVAAISTAEAGVGAGYQASANVAADREPMHNTLTVAQLGAASGLLSGTTVLAALTPVALRAASARWGGFSSSANLWKKGGVGVESADSLARKFGRSPNEPYANMEEMIADLHDLSGWKHADIIEEWKASIFKDLPFDEFVESIMRNKVADIAADTPASTPRSPKYVTPADMDKIFKDVDGVGTLSEKIGETDPAGTDASGNPFYNSKATATDLQNDATWLRGLNKDGTRATGDEASIRQDIFNKYDDAKLTQWLKRSGAKKYAELLQRIEANKLKIKKEVSVLNPSEIYQRAVDKSFTEMGVPPGSFKKLTAADKIFNPIKATYTQVAKTAKEVVNNPQLLYTPIKDIFVDVKYAATGAKQYASDLYNFAGGNVDAFGRIVNLGKQIIPGGVDEAKRQRNNIANLLRDFEGNKLAGEIDVKAFTDWIKRQIPDPEKRSGLYFFMEGESELSRYNNYRIRNKQEPIELSPYEKQIGSVGRKFLDDMLEWAQKSELFNLFRAYPGAYKRAKSLHGDTAVDKRGRIPDKELWDFVNASTNPRGLMLQIGGKKKPMGRFQNYVPHLIKKVFAPSERELGEWSVTDAHRAGQLQTNSKFLKKRSYETAIDAIEAGETLYSTDLAEVFNIYGKSMLRAQINARVVDQLTKLKTVDGHPMLTSKADAPDHYVEFKHPNFTGPDGNYLYANSNIAPDLRLYFDTNEPNVASRVLQNIILIAKRATIGLSGFHMMALGWSGFGTGGFMPNNLWSVTKDVLPLNYPPVTKGIRKVGSLTHIDKLFGRVTGKPFDPESFLSSRGANALAGRDPIGQKYLAVGLRNGLGLGVIEELKGDTLINGMRRLADWTERKINNITDDTYIKPLGKALGKGVSKSMYGIAKAQELLDFHLWDHVNSGLKATTYLTTMEKMVYQDAKRVNELLKAGKPAKLTDINLIAQRAAQFTNDAYGNQNWAQMAMNVESFMGHRIAAALNKPSMRGYIRTLIFAPDWTTSNLRVLGKSVSGAVPIGKDELAHGQYLMYALRAAVLFAWTNEVLQLTSGQKSILEERGNELLYANLGDGKVMQTSKQVAEVLSLFTGDGPVGVLGHKLSAPVKAIRDADSVGEAVGNFAESAIPISVQVGMEQGFDSAVKGAVGFPVYKN